DFAHEGLRQLNPLDHIARTLLPDPEDSYTRVATLEASLYMRNQLLRDTDWASMAHSLEVRIPLVDAILLNKLAPAIVGATPVRKLFRDTQGRDRVQRGPPLGAREDVTRATLFHNQLILNQPIGR
ncbi:MAG: hypothetical protein KGO23_01070, partial [Nitrospirota bacterium]|nr:hypothetical protein [Nitrospirota bacterium]